MENDYIYIMQRKENQCRAYLQKADAIFEENGGIHTKDEGKNLQEAAKIQYEMAQLSDGEERKYHLRRQKEISARIEEVLKAVSPDTYYRMMEDRARAAAKASNEIEALRRPKKDSSPKGSGSGKASNAGSNDDIKDEVVSRWFKESPSHSFEEVSGMNDLKEQLKECIVDTQLVAIREFLKMDQMHSFFFIGPPGCGKTYIIEAFAHELMEKDYTYMSLDGSDILSRYVGDAEKIITRLFEEAEKHEPCIVFVDEIDGVCKNRSLPDLPVWASSMTTAFLTAYNRIKSSQKNVIFIGATNYPDQVDDAMLDRVRLIRVPFPDEEAMESAYCRKFSGIVSLEEGFTFNDMAKASHQYNYRDIDRLTSIVKNLILKDAIAIYGDQMGAVEAMKNQEYHLTRELFQAAQADYTPTPKDEIIKELDEWEKRFNKQKEQDG